VTMLPSLARNGTNESTPAVALCHCRDGVGRGVMSPPSLTGDGVAESMLAVA
jgi:hypothetical protein